MTEIRQNKDVVHIPADEELGPVPADLYDEKTEERLRMYGQMVASRVAGDKTAVISDEDNAGFTDDDPEVVRAIRNDAFKYVEADLSHRLHESDPELGGYSSPRGDTEVNLQRHELRYPAPPPSTAAPASAEVSERSEHVSAPMRRRSHRRPIEDKILRLSDVTKPTDHE